MDCLTAFTLKKSYITTPGGARSPISEVIDGFLSGVPAASTRPTGTAPSRTPVAPIGPPAGRGWAARRFDIKIEVDGIPVPIPTHKIDNFKKMPQDARGIGVEVEWNNKTEFYDRDLNNFRLLRNLGVLSVGVIINPEGGRWWCGWVPVVARRDGDEVLRPELMRAAWQGHEWPILTRGQRKVPALRCASPSAYDFAF
jgi:hypothetical protein